MADIFWWGEIEYELRKRKAYYKFGKKGTIGDKGDREECMRFLEQLRNNGLYPHTDCSETCKQKGMTKFIILLIQNT